VNASIDVAIVGGGPAGSACALALARAGVDVVIFERAPMPREKICGDLLGSDAVALIHRLGFGAEVLAGASPIDAAILIGPRGDHYGSLGAPRVRATATPAYMLARAKLDRALLDVARDAGARVRFECVSDIIRDKTGRIAGVATTTQSVSARVVIGADGWGSIVSRAIGNTAPVDRNVAVTVRAYATGMPLTDTRMRFFVNDRADGYGWIFPMGDGIANIGLGAIRSEGSFDVREAWQRFIGPQATAAPYLHGATIGAARAWPIPLGPSGCALARPGAILVGDAASLASPLSGSGIATALASGARAARFARLALGGDDDVWEAYAHETRNSIVRRLRLEAWAHAIFGTAAGVDRYARLTRLPGAGALLSRAMLALG
jgi:geranylgeranyl reductase family protein